MIKKLTLVSILLAIPLNATATNPPQSFIQPSIFLPVFKFFFTIAIMILGVAFIIAILLNKFSPQYKERSLSSIIIDFIGFLLSDKKQKSRNKERFTSTYKYSDEYPYEKSNLLAKSEKDFFKALEIAILNKYHIFPQVGLSRIIDVPQETYNRQEHLHQILPRSVDYVICDRENFATLLVIELDGESHNTKNQQDKDNFKDKALNKAGINLLRVIAQKTYNTGQLRETLHTYIDLKGSNQNQYSKDPQPQPSKEKIKFCNAFRCNGIMNVKTGRDNKKYWVCDDCGNSVPYTGAPA